MLSLLAIICPPFAVLLVAPAQALKNLGLTLCFYFPGMLHARAVVDDHQARRQFDSLVRALDRRAALRQPRHAA